MPKNLAILLLMSGIAFMPNALLADDDDVEEVSQAASLVEEDFLSGKEISYIQGYVEGMDSCCKWWHFCRYKTMPNIQVDLYIRGSNGQGGEKWTKVGESQTDSEGFYSFGKIKNYCGPIQIKVPNLQHSPVVDYRRDCGSFDNGRELDIVGKF